MKPRVWYVTDPLAIVVAGDEREAAVVLNAALDEPGDHVLVKVDLDQARVLFLSVGS